MPCVKVRVRGLRPQFRKSKYAENRRQLATWRELIASECLKTRDSLPKTTANQLESAKPPFKVTLTFHIPGFVECCGVVPFVGGGCDLDNLAKPVLDTIFQVIYRKDADWSPPPTGVLSKCNDATVRDLRLIKEPVGDELAAGVDILLEW